MTEPTTDAIARSTTPANLEQEMRRSYLDYAMSVIVGRALPDVHDGLKPVHRRVLYAMYELNNEWNKPYKKSARITGDVIGKYHPHSDVAVYDAIVRMAQDFSMRYPLIDGQGNFGSVDGDSPAAMRYTEIRLQRIAHELLSDLDKETVNFGPNYDDTEMQPLVLPARVPNLLVNGSSGIAVGMATSIPPHNLREVIDGTLAYIDNNEIDVLELIKIIPGPDFPTAAIINGAESIAEAYASGRGKVYMRARVVVEESNGRQALIVYELPYQVNKARLLEKIAELVKLKRLDGISSLRDESDKSGMRMVIELKRNEIPEVVLNNLYRMTHLETVFSINMVALVNNQPRVFALKEIISEFVRHRREVVTRRTVFNLRKARERAHLLEGYAVALANIDPIIALIKASPSPAEARLKLMAKPWPQGTVGPLLKRLHALLEGPVAEHLPALAGAETGADGHIGLGKGGYTLSETQAQAILDLRLHRLTGLEQEKIHGEYNEVLDRITDLADVLGRRERLMEVICNELREIRERYGDDRRTEIWQKRSGIETEDLIAEEDMVVTLTDAGYAKSQPLATYRSQRRGGRGRTATRTRDEDFIKRLFLANSHDTVLCFSNRGVVYWLKVYQLPQAAPQARGKPLVNLLPLHENEQITTLLPVRSYDEQCFVTMATTRGYLKRCRLSAFKRSRSVGLRAIKLTAGDELVGVSITEGDGDIMLFSDVGKSVRFKETLVRAVGRTARGVRGMRLGADERIISMITPAPGQLAGGMVLTATARGYGKRTALAQYPVKGRGGKGVISIRVNERNGPVVGAELVQDGDGVMLITDNGTLIRTGVDQIRITGRNAMGVLLIRLRDGETLHGMSSIDVPDDEDNGSNGAEGNGADEGGANGANAGGSNGAEGNGSNGANSNGADSNGANGDAAILSDGEDDSDS